MTWWASSSEQPNIVVNGATVLDSRMVYSRACFKDEDQSLDNPQLRKIGHICGKLDLRPGEVLLDVGCGWGCLVTHAIAEYGIIPTGCTLSTEQYNFADERVAERGLAGGVSGRRAAVRQEANAMSD